MANYGSWSTNVPSGSSLVKDFPALHRSEKSILTGTLDEEHYFNSTSSASAGEHRPGSAAPYFGATSKISTIAKPGYRLYFDTDTLQLWALSSASSVAVRAPNSTYKGIKLANNSTQTIPGNGNYQILTLAGEDWDTSGFASPSTTYVNIPSDVTGIFDVFLHAAFSTRTDNGGGTYGVRLYKNGSATTIFTVITQPDATYGGGAAPAPKLNVADQIELDSGDSIQLRAVHNNVSALSMGVVHCSLTLAHRGNR